MTQKTDCYEVLWESETQICIAFIDPDTDEYVEVTRTKTQDNI